MDARGKRGARMSHVLDALRRSGDNERAKARKGSTVKVFAVCLEGSLFEVAEAGEWSVVYGIGGVGLGAVQVARARGARVIAVSRTEEKLRKAEDLGAEFSVNASRGSVSERIREITGGRGADVVLECVGTAESMIASSSSLGRRGRLVFIGYSEDSFSVHPIQLVVFEQKVLGSVDATLGDLQEALDLVSRGVVNTVVDRTILWIATSRDCRRWSKAVWLERRCLYQIRES